MPVRVTPLARDDIRQGETYFNGKRVGLSNEFVDEVLAALDRIGDWPLAAGEVGDGVRAVGVRRFGYVVYYRTDGTAVEVLAVLYGGRSPDVWQSRV